MRCPKCGYTSFDHLATCKKCLKSLADVSATVNGTTYDAVAPLFLKITREMEQTSVPHTVQKLDFEEFEVEDSANEPLRQGIDTEFILDELPLDNASSEITQKESQEALLVELDDFQEVSPRNEFTLDLEMKSEEEVGTMPPIDFGELDITDLAPPSRQTPRDTLAPQFTNDNVLADASQPAVTSTVTQPSTNRVAVAPAASLEDLNFNGLDLEAPAKIVTGSAAGKRYLPSVKTGTALDKFDIDLGELFAEKK